MWEFIEALNTILGIIGFLLTAITMCLAFKINKKLKTAQDKRMMRDKFPQYKGELKALHKLLDNNEELSDASIIKYSRIFSEIDEIAQYFSPEDKDLIKQCTILLHKKDLESRTKLVSLTARLVTRLEKETTYVTYS